ncbi:MAG: RNA polymerase sigma factor [Candidatus Eisenbacteria bacterium]
MSLGATALLLERVRSGDEAALRNLVELYRPLLERWASGRLPGHARGLVDTVDLVHVSLVRVLKQVGTFESAHPGAFLAYLRRTVLNQMRNEIRAAQSRPRGDAEADATAAWASVEDEVGRETLEAYEAALAKLPEDDQAAVVLRVEFRLPYQEIAATLGRPSADAVRKQVTRALLRLAALMEP